jgi:hypothetical protein
VPPKPANATKTERSWLEVGKVGIRDQGDPAKSGDLPSSWTISPENETAAGLASFRIIMARTHLHPMRDATERTDSLQ